MSYKLVCQQKRKRIVLVSWRCCREIHSLTVLQARSPNYGVGWALLPSSEGEFSLASSIFRHLENTKRFLRLYVAFFLVPESQISCLSLGTTPIIGCCCSVAESCSALCDPVDCNTPGSSDLHYLLELAQSHGH